MTERPLWTRFAAQPRVAFATMKATDVPLSSGVYSLWRDLEACRLSMDVEHAVTSSDGVLMPVYVGKATSLQQRLGKAHRGRGRSMGNSALRRNVAHHLDIATPDDIKKGIHAVTKAEVAQVNGWLDGCFAAWIQTQTAADALELETALKREWKPELTHR